MTKPETAAALAAYSELEAAVEAFYTAAQRMTELVPALRDTADMVCDEVSAFIVAADEELDEVI